MALTTLRKLRIVCHGPDSGIIAGASVVADLQDQAGNPAFDDQIQNLVLPRRVATTSDANGIATLELAVNHGTRYQVQTIAGAVVLMDAVVEIPAGSASEVLYLRDVIRKVKTLSATAASNLSKNLLAQLIALQSQVAQDAQKTHEDRLFVEDVVSEIDPGATGGSSTITLNAAQDIAGQRAVVIEDGLIRYATHTDLIHARLRIGISNNSAPAGSPVTVKFVGKIEENSWNWVRDMPVYLGVNGALTQTEPLTGFSLVLAMAITPKQVFIDIGIPFEL